MPNYGSYPTFVEALMLGNISNLVQEEVGPHPLLHEAEQVLWGEARLLAPAVDDAESCPPHTHTNQPSAQLGIFLQFIVSWSWITY